VSRSSCQVVRDTGSRLSSALVVVNHLREGVEDAFRVALVKQSKVVGQDAEIEAGPALI